MSDLEKYENVKGGSTLNEIDIRLPEENEKQNSLARRA